MSESNDATVDADASGQVADSLPQAKAKRGIFGFFKRGDNNQAPQAGEAVTDESKIGSTNPEEKLLSPTPEAVKDPEAVKADLQQSLVKLVDMQVEERFRTLDLYSKHLSPDNPAILEEKAKIEKLKAETRELNSQLLTELENARGTLGNFCEVIGDEDGNKAVLLKTPLIRQITQTTLAGPAITDGNIPRFRTKSEVKDVFFVNKEGVCKFSVEEPDAHTLESVGNSQSDGPDKTGSGMTISPVLPEGFERDILRKRKEVWQEELRVALNDEPNKENRYIFNAFTAGDFRAPDVEGQDLHTDGLSEPLFRNENDFGVSNTIVRVTTSLDAGAAFSASVEAAKNFTKGELAEPALFDPIPNPVSAEPMTESAKDLNSAGGLAVENDANEGVQEDSNSVNKSDSVT